MNTLLGSSATYAGLMQVIAAFYCTQPERVELRVTGSVYVGERLMLGVRWQSKGKRIRFERVTP